MVRTTPVWLVNSKGKYTIHDFVARQPQRWVGINGEESGDERPCVALIFRCRETGVCRQYGLENPVGSVCNPEDHDEAAIMGGV